MKIKGKKFRVSVFFTTAIVLSGCVTSGSSTKKSEETILNQLNEAHAGLVVYRDKDADDLSTKNIYIEGEYLTSLAPGHYKTALLCPEEQRITVVDHNNDPGYKDKIQAGNYYDFPTNAITYLKVNEESGTESLQFINVGQAEEELKELKEQTHTISRVNPNKSCNQQVLYEETLQGSALFKFNEYSEQNLLPGGRDSIIKLAEAISVFIPETVLIVVSGHTDPQGDAKYNQQLSERRAQTVANLLASQLAYQGEFQIQGFGKEKPVVTGCQEQYPANKDKRIACDQENRRVEVKIIGENAR